ncbi:UNVERIFIED_CONTAM: hypothetical protein Sangu_0459500 [Sesamum angustifolium]|uniref:Mitochondrial transcription termination factor family protein n=1 Tax=Sesamum angustifolium TaxID=2727405 RepID=A0AAW2QUL4_9LAMI
MFAVHLRNKLFSIQQIFADSTASLLEIQLLDGATLLRNYKGHIFVGFSSLSETGKERQKFVKKLEEEKSKTVSYLINSCGLSPETAVSASEKVCVGNLRKSNSVLALLEKQGFSRAQIATLVRKRPRILVAKEKTLLPKFEFFQSIGVSKDLLAKIISREPTFFTRSLENQIIPNYNFLKSVLGTDERVAAAMKRTSWIFCDDVNKSLSPNVKVLRELKVPESCIKLLLTHYPEALFEKADEFRASVSKVLEMGFSPLKSMFVLALHAISGDANKVTWARCYQSYSDWGWSEDDIHMAFRKHPNCMLMSQEKISETMDFLVHKMGWNSRTIATCPTVLFFNLKSRIIPRCSVIELLSSRGLITKRLKLSTVLIPSEKSFLERFVVKFEKEIPELPDFYKGKVGVQES